MAIEQGEIDKLAGLANGYIDGCGGYEKALLTLIGVLGSRLAPDSPTKEAMLALTMLTTGMLKAIDGARELDRCPK